MIGRFTEGVEHKSAPAEGGNVKVESSATTVALKGFERCDINYAGQTPSKEDIQKLYDKTASKDGAEVLKIEVLIDDE